jgi:histidinol-phosphate aminotransferase
MKQWMRKDLINYEPYHASEVPHRIKLDANESPFNMPEPVRDTIIKWLQQEENLNIYPDTDCLELKAELSKFWNVKSENIICGVGSDQLIEYICKVFLEPGDIVIAPDPSFSMYGLTAVMNRGVLVNVPLYKDYNYDAEAIIECCKKNNPKLLILCTPNNPTGKSISVSDTEKILNEVKCPVILDEAYAEFSKATMIPYIEKYPNMIVLRTFSKAYSLAGMRIGYGIASKEMIDIVEVVRAPYNLNTMSQKIAIEILRNREIYKQRIEYLEAERDWLQKELGEFDYISIYPSDANFIYINTKINIAQELKNRGILIRAFKPCNKVYYSRISVGSRQQNEELIKALKEIEVK